ncbi:oxidoreductase [Mycobacteroides abscessus]|uniref:oxidoreductase n=1 Tax=Mycobacteroides abscessus TaxID=36809 RepID=UPI0018779509|nr:hypothetical protein [Mycobacteroides abscessus]
MSRSTIKWSTTDIPDQTGRVVIVTGANTGLGLETAKALAAHGAHVVLAVRNAEKGKAAADAITAAHSNADVTLQFGTNHLGHYAFTGLLLERLLPVEGSRVVTVSSIGHRIRAAIHFDDLQWERDYDRVAAYGQSKLANLLFTYELQRRLAGTNTVALAAHPGGSNTELARNSPLWVRAVFDVVAPLLVQGADMGALPTLRAATDPAALGGQYYGPDGFMEQRGNPRVVASSEQSYNLDLQRRLWSVSEELTDVVFPVK